MTVQCTTCRYLDIEPNETPCNHCGNFNMWETQEYRTVEELEKLKEEVENLCFVMYSMDGKTMFDITKSEIVYRINKHIEELKGDNNEKNS